jgi:hypothetical protein
MEVVKAAFLAQYAHVIMGEELKTMRISGIVGARTKCHTEHVFFRLIHQSPTSEHYIRVDGLQNFISMDSTELVYHYGTLENNVIENVLQL